MKTTTTWAFRRKYINTYKARDFECFDDYFTYLHLNPHVLWAHALGGTSGALMFPWAIRALARLSPWPAVLAVFVYYGIGFLSHFTGDGVVSETGKSFFPKRVFFQSYRSVIKMIYNTFSGRIKDVEQDYMKKYPHTLWVFDKNAPRPAHIDFTDEPQPATAGREQASA